MNELYYRHGELTNFKRSIASTLGITGEKNELVFKGSFSNILYLESSKSVSCPKLIRTLQQVLEDAKSNELITFKKMAKINDMNEYEISTIIQNRFLLFLLERFQRFVPTMILCRIIINLSNKWRIYSVNLFFTYD